MFLAKVRISEFMGIEEMEFPVGPGITTVTGENGTGKTSIAMAIQTALNGGHNAKLMRGGFPAEIGLVLQDEETGYAWDLTKPIRESKPDPVLKINGVVQKRPAEKLKRLFTDRTLNPISLLSTPAEDLAKRFLQAIPMSVTAEDIQAALGSDEPVDVEGHALTVIARYEKAVFDQRTGTNRLVKDKEAHAGNLAAALPQEKIEDCQGELVEATASLTLKESEAEQLEYSRQSALLRIRNSAHVRHTARLADAGRDLTAQIDVLRSDAAAQIAEIERNLLESTARLSTRIQTDAAAIKAGEFETLSAEMQECNLYWDGKRDSLGREVGDLRSRQRELQSLMAEYGRVQGLRLSLDETQAKLQDLYTEQDHLNTSLENLAGLRDGLVAGRMIQGVTVTGGDVFVDGVIWPLVNLARRIEVAIELALLSAGELKLICLDDMDCLSARTMAIVCQKIRDRGVQAVMTRVSSDPTVRILADDLEEEVTA